MIKTQKFLKSQTRALSTMLKEIQSLLSDKIETQKYIELLTQPHALVVAEPIYFFHILVFSDAQTVELRRKFEGKRIWNNLLIQC